MSGAAGHGVERRLYEADAIAARVDALAAEIAAAYRDRELCVLSLMTGALVFTADLVRRLPVPLQVECLAVASYHGGATSRGELQFRQNVWPDFTGRHVLIVDDILDTGLTLAAVRERVAASGAASVAVCVLLRKAKQRIRPVEPEWVGFDIADEFVVGYGLDYAGLYRNLPFIGVLVPPPERGCLPPPARSAG